MRSLSVTVLDTQGILVEQRQKVRCMKRRLSVICTRIPAGHGPKANSVKLMFESAYVSPVRAQ